MSTIGAEVIIEIIKARTRVDQNPKTEVRVSHTRDNVCIEIVKSLSTLRKIVEIQRQKGIIVITVIYVKGEIDF